MCLDEVPDILVPDNVIEWWKEAMKMNYDNIKGKCEEIMAANFGQITHQTDFLNLDLKQMQHYMSDLCGDTVHSDDVIDATIRWTGHKEERVDFLEDLLSNIQLNKCSDEGIKGIIDTHESLLDKTPMVYKLLLKTSASIETDTSNASAGSSTSGEANLDEPLACLRGQPEFQQMQQLIQQNPNYLPEYLKQFRESNPGLQQMSTMNQQQFVEMLNEPIVGEVKKQKANASVKALFVIGGQEDGTVSPVCWKLSQTNEFVHFCDIPVDDLAIKSSVCQIPQGLAVTGGIDMDLCIIYIAFSGSWFRLQNLLHERRCHGSIHVNGMLYILGGFLTDDPIASSSVQSLKIEGGVWQIEPDMPLPVKFPKVSDIDGNVYMLDSEVTNELFQLEVQTNTWRKRAPLPVKESCFGISMTSARGRLYVAGRKKGRMCAYYEPVTDTWCFGHQPLLKHKYGSLVCYNNKLILLGGSFKGCTDEVEEYDIDEGSWTVCSYKMPKRLHLHTCVVLDMNGHN